MRATGMCLAVLVLAACDRGVAPPVQPARIAPAPASAAEASDASPTAQAPAGRDEFAGQAYARMRATLVERGWLPLRTPACRTNVGGDAPVCDDLPETDSCSGDGHCLTKFVDPRDGRTLTVHAYGAAERWNTPGREEEFAVMSTEAGALPPAARAACPAKDFEGVLRHFAATPTARAALSRTIVRASELHSDGDGDRLVPVAYTAADYPGFDITFDGRAFHHVDAAGKVDGAPLAVEVQPGSDGGNVVRYRYGMSEGRAFRFERDGDCWRLAEELPPPLD